MTHPSIRPVVSEEAQRWIEGTFEPTAYFAVAREVEIARAQAEVVRRLRNHRPVLSWWPWNSSGRGEGVRPSDGRPPPTVLPRWWRTRVVSRGSSSSSRRE